MDLWTIIPVKPFALGKSRLATVLGTAERAALNRALFRHVLTTAIAAFGAARIVIVTADPEAASLAHQHGAQAVPEGAPDDLNAALALAIDYACARGAEAALVLPSDLPHLECADLTAIAKALRQGACQAAGCVVAPDEAWSGTNALAMAPPDATLLRFGRESFPEHCNLADARKLPVRIVTRPGLAFDLDTPEDYRALISGGAPLRPCVAF